VSAIDIAPLEQVAKEVNAELKTVIDSDKDQLCFFFVYFTWLEWSCPHERRVGIWEGE